MSRLSYGSFEEILRPYIKPVITKLDLANILFPAPVDQELKEAYKVDSATVTRVCTGQRPLPPGLRACYAKPNTLGQITAAFSTNIISRIQKVDRPALAKKILALAQNDETMPQEAAAAFETSSKNEDLCAFLAKVYLYAITREDSTEKTTNLPRQNHFFCGRENLLTEISAQYAEDVHIQGLYGMGGVGKTQLALQYAYTHFNEYETIWWINAENKATLQASIFKFLSTLKRLPKGKNDDSVRETFLRYLDKHNDWLLIYDNAEYGTTEEYETLLSYFPQHPQGRILLTTRCANAFENANHTEVAIFKKYEAVQFLQQRTQLNDVLNAELLAEQLGYLPLALEYAAAYIRETPGIDCKSYLRKLEHCGIKILDQKVGYQFYKNTVRQAFHITLDKILEDIEQNCISRSAEQFLKICAFLAPDEINMDIFTQYSNNLPNPVGQVLRSELDCDELIRRLTKYSLIQTVEQDLFIHRLLQEVLIDEMDLSNREKWIQCVRNVFRDFFSYVREIPMKYARPIISSSIPHVQNVLARYVQLCKSMGKKINATDLWEIERDFFLWTTYQMTDDSLIYSVPYESQKRLEYERNDVEVLQIAVDFYDTVLNNDNIFLAAALSFISQVDLMFKNTKVAFEKFNRSVKIANTIVPAKLPKNNATYQGEALSFASNVFSAAGQFAIIDKHTDLLRNSYTGFLRTLEAAYTYGQDTVFLDLDVICFTEFYKLSCLLAQFAQRAFMVRFKMPKSWNCIPYQHDAFCYFYPTEVAASSCYDSIFDVILQDEDSKRAAKKLNRPWTTVAFPTRIRSCEDILKYLMDLNIGKQFLYARRSVYEAIATLAEELHYQDIAKQYRNKLRRLEG